MSQVVTSDAAGRMTAIGGDVKGLIARAHREAQRRGQAPTTAHLLLVMLQGQTPAGELLTSLGLREGDLLGAIRVVGGEPQSALERAVERAYRVAKATDANVVTPSHLLFAIARDGRSAAHKSLETMGTGPRRVQEAVMHRLGLRPSRTKSTAPRTETPAADAGAEPPTRSAKASQPQLTPLAECPGAADPPIEPAAEPVAVTTTKARPRNRRVRPKVAATPFTLDPKRFPMLHALGRNLTEKAACGEIDEVIGRDREIEQLLDVLARRRSNNPLLVGPPGVGKTAIVEGLALRLAQGGDGVHGLRNRIVVEISAGSLVSGTGVRGALSERIGQLKKEVRGLDGSVVVFIDEVHAIFTGGESPDDLSHELKASLARGELPCIGATTDAEYRKYVERDAALARRFSPIHIAEPTAEDAMEILRGIAPRYEVHHAVAYHPEAVDASVELSVRYMPEQNLPDKAIGLLDLAGARTKRRGGQEVHADGIAQVVAEQIGVPAEQLVFSDQERLLQLESLLEERVVGHASAMVSISDALRKGAAGFRGNRPLASFLFLGPTGVGKTETARAINNAFFPGCGMTHLDMSEFSERHSVARLFGAPPGYVGHETGGELTEAIRRRPYQLILLDEIEKAHIEVLQALLPLLEEGHCTDGKGRTVDARHTIVVMTSNLGADAGTGSAGRIGFASDGDEEERRSMAAIDAARHALPPEFWNRIDEPLFFGPLGRGDVGVIARRMLAQVGRQLVENQGVHLEAEDSAIEALVDGGGYDTALGARPMRRLIGRVIEAQLASAVLEGDLAAGDRVLVYAEDGEIAFRLLGPASEAAE